MNFRELIMYWMILLDYTYSLDVVLRPLYGPIFRGLFNVTEINAFVCVPFTTRVFYALYFLSLFGSGCCRNILHYIWADNVYMSYILYFVIYAIYFCCAQNTYMCDLSIDIHFIISMPGLLSTMKFSLDLSCFPRFLF